MRKRVAAIAGVAVLGALWLFWPRAEEPVEPDPPALAQLKERIRTAKARPLHDRPLHRRPPPLPVEEPEVETPLALPEEEELAPGWGRLVVDVVDEQGRSDPRANLWVTDCMAEPDGRGVWKVNEATTCDVQARRRDGALFARAGERVAVPAGDTTYLQLELPSARTGGLGVQIAWDGGAIRVDRVFPGTPAALEGLEAGDRIVEVDGVPVTELGLEGFVQAMTGPEGTDVHFVLEYEDEEGVIAEELAITRAFFDT